MTRPPLGPGTLRERVVSAARLCDIAASSDDGEESDDDLEAPDTIAGGEDA